MGTRAPPSGRDLCCVSRAFVTIGCGLFLFYYYFGGSFKSSWLSTHRLKQPAVLWLELEVRYFSIIDAAWLVMLQYRVLYQKEVHIGYLRWIFLRLKVIGSQCIQISVFPQKHSMLTWFIIAEIDFVSLRSGKNKGKVALVKFFVSSRSSRKR